MKLQWQIAIILLVLISSPAAAAHKRAAGHIVRSGETAYSLCQRYHISMAELAMFNPGVNVNSLRAGEVVKVGSVETRARNARPASQPSDELSTGADQTRVTEVVPNAKTSPAKPEVKPAAKTVAAAKPKPKPNHKKTGYLSYYDSPAGAAKDTEPSVTVSLVRVVLSLIFVVALAYLSLLAIKQFSSGKATHKSPGRNIRVLETTGLGANRALHVVQIDGRQLLVGSTASQVNLIAELDTPPNTEEPEADQPANFAGILKRFSSPNQERATTASKLSAMLQEGASFLQQKTSAAKSMRKKGNPDEA